MSDKILILFGACFTIFDFKTIKPIYIKHHVVRVCVFPSPLTILQNINFIEIEISGKIALNYGIYYISCISYEATSNGNCIEYMLYQFINIYLPQMGKCLGCLHLDHMANHTHMLV